MADGRSEPSLKTKEKRNECPTHVWAALLPALVLVLGPKTQCIA